MPRFSVILVHYQGATPHRELLRGVNSLFAQTFQDFELLAYHNGPLIDTSVTMPVPFICSEVNQDDWGYGNRDRGMREATRWRRSAWRSIGRLGCSWGRRASRWTRIT